MHRLEDNIKMDLVQVEYGVVVWFNFQLAVGFISDSYAKAQMNWIVYPCSEDVSKTSFLIKVLLVYLTLKVECPICVTQPALSSGRKFDITNAVQA
jgi:hypothetical protein